MRVGKGMARAGIWGGLYGWWIWRWLCIWGWLWLVVIGMFWNSDLMLVCLIETREVNGVG